MEMAENAHRLAQATPPLRSNPLDNSHLDCEGIVTDEKGFGQKGAANV
jgi:hypothetical protein